MPRKEDVFSETKQSLSHSEWDCTYHVAIPPKHPN
jgi:hypothetical protein